MKILAFNGSPRGRHSNTDHILQPFLEGAREAGAETETIYLKSLEIKACLGCVTCWAKTPGVCVHKDDMLPLLEKMRQADITVYATPLYTFTVSGLMKDFMDRHIPNLDPHIVKRGEHYTHPLRYEDARPKRRVLISNCGFPERHHFSALVKTFELICQASDAELTAAILCPAGELLGNPALLNSFDWYLEAARRAGREVVEGGYVTPETQAVLEQDLAETDIFLQVANAYWDSQIVSTEGPLKVELEAEVAEPGRPMPPPTAPPATLRDTIAGMPVVFNAEAAGDMRAVIQYDVDGEEPGQYYLHIANGMCQAFEGTHPTPTLTIHTPSEVWLRISRGELDGATAMMQGFYTIEGDLNLLTKTNKLFTASSTKKAPPATTPTASTSATQARNARQVIEGMPRVFNPARAGDLRAVLQFHVTGDDPGDYHLRIANAKCTFHEGVAADATTTITTPSEIWLAIAQGKMDSGQAMMQGLYTASGDFGFMMQMQALFSGADAGAAPLVEPGGPIKIRGMTWLPVAFAPWIAHWVLGGIGLGALWSIGLPLMMGVGVWLYRRAFIKPTWLDAGGPLFFAAAGMISLLDPNFWATYGGVLGSLAMAGIWMGTLATDTSLTADYSRWDYSPELARNPLFLKTNGVITVFWAAIFLLQAAITLAGAANPMQKALWMVMRYLTLAPAFWFTAWFQKWYPAHAAAGGK